MHATLAVARGRSRAVLERVVNEMSDTLATFFSQLDRQRYLALSIELREFPGMWAYKSLNNIHQRYTGCADSFNGR